MGFPSSFADVTKEVTGVSSFPTAGVIPAATTLTGTFTSVGSIVTGVGTFFESEIMGSKWLYSASLNQVRQIRQIYNQTTLHLVTPFTANIAGAEAVRITGVKNKSVSCFNRGVTTAVFNNRDIIANTTENASNEWGLTPITYDAISSTLQFQIIRSV